jgi:hypothetical protein
MMKYCEKCGRRLANGESCPTCDLVSVTIKSSYDTRGQLRLLAILRRCREAVDETFWARVNLVLSSPDVGSDDYRIAADGLKNAERAFFDILIEIDEVLAEE